MFENNYKYFSSFLVFGFLIFAFWLKFINFVN